MKIGFHSRLAAATCAASFFLAVGQAPAALTILPGHVPPATANLAAIGALPAATPMHLAIGLPLRNPEALDSLLQQIYDPASPNYRHYLTPEQFTERFGPSPEDYQGVLDFARTNGLTVTATYSNRMVLGVTGGVADVERAFHVKMRTYQHPVEGRTFYAPETEPAVDARLRITHVQGMSDYSRPHPMLQKVPAGAQPASGSSPGGGYMGLDFRNAYLPGTALNGSGQIVGLLQFDGYLASDIRLYETIAGLPNVQLQNILLDGFDGSAGGNNDEVCLDIETSISMAPGLTKVVVFEGYEPDSILSSMASHPEIKQFSASWGYGIDATTDQLYKQLATQGQTFLNASGDGDAWVPIIHPISYGCLEDTNITLVGGTTLTMNGSGASYKSEKAWNWGFIGNFNWNPDGYFGTSGGVSATVGIPSWQQGISMTTNLGSTTKRNTPDVALTADNVFVVSSGGQGGLYGGTSCASPLWAGFMACVNQQTTVVGSPSIGFLAPAVYALAKTAGYTNYFHDTTTGDNTWDQSTNKFFAVTGYDLCTGWGTPNGTGLIFALAGRAPRTGFLRLSVNPSSSSTLLNVTTQNVFVTVNDGGSDVANATVTAVIPGVTNLTLLNNGQAPDVQSNDAIYSAAFQVPASVTSLTMTVAANATNEIGATNVVYYSVVPIPSNDNFTNGTKVPAVGATYLSNNRFATLEPGEPAHDADAGDAASLWWQWTPSTATNVFIDTFGSKIDNVLAVYTGSNLSSLVQVVATNSTLALNQPAYVGFSAQAGVAYHIAVASSSSSSLGSLVLHVTPGGQLDTTAPFVSVINPQNGQTMTNHGILLSGEASDPTPNASGVSQVSVSVNSVATIATGTTNWTAAVALQPDLNVITITAVDAAGNVSVPTILEVDYEVPTVANDFFVSAANFPLSGTSGVVSNNNANATKENGEPDIAGDAGGKSLWWSFKPTSDGVLTLNTTNSTFDTLLGLFTGPDVADLTAIAEDDDAYPGAPGGFSYISQAVRANVAYAIAVDGYDGASGNVSLSYSFTPSTVYNLMAGSTPGGTVQLTTLNPLGGITVLPGQSGDFAAGSTVTLTAIPGAATQFNNWSGDVSSTANPLVFVVQTNAHLTANFAQIPFTDGFESGDFTHLPWITMGDAPPWFVQSNIVCQGMYAARSGAITDSQTNSLVLTTNFNVGIGSFDFKVSSETNWDFLRFTVDGVLFKQWSGEVGWANYAFALNAGTHTLAWSYVKDPNDYAGLDAAFIDDVNLPIVSPPPPQPPLLQLQLQGDGSILMTVTGQGSGQYVIQTSTDLLNWQNFSTNTASGGVIQITIPANPANPAQFYRAHAL
jgi:hypothetical protein